VREIFKIIKEKVKMGFKHLFSSKAIKNSDENINITQQQEQVQEQVQTKQFIQQPMPVQNSNQQVQPQDDFYNNDYIQDNNISTSTNDDFSDFFDNMYGDSNTTTQPSVAEDDYNKAPVNTNLIKLEDQDMFDESEYNDTEDEEAAPIENIEINDKRFKNTLDQVAKRGNLLVVSGLQGSGTSTLAANIASTLNRIGYKVIIIDLDTETKSQHYMSKDSFNSLNMDSDNLKTALQQDLANIYSYITLIRRDFHLLGTGIACEPYKIDDIANIDKVVKMIELLKKEYNFIICDIPLKVLITSLADLITRANDVILNIDGGTYGILDTINILCNADSELTLETIFSDKTNVVFNKCRGTKKVLDKVINVNSRKALEVIDKLVADFAGCEIDYKFNDMRPVGSISLSPEFESFVNAKEQWCDTPKGKEIILQIIKNIMVK